MKFSAALFTVFAFLMPTSFVQANSDVLQCKAIAADDERLACFDAATDEVKAEVASSTGSGIAKVAGLSTPGSMTGSARYSWTVDGDYIEGVVSVSQSAHTGTGGLYIDMPLLPAVALANTPVGIKYEGLRYVSPPFAFVAAGARRILWRQSASGASYSNVLVPAGAASFDITFRYRWR